MTWILAKPVPSSLRDRVQWVADMLNASESIAAKIGISPEAIVAQAALESAWGQSRQGEFGLFGQKADASWKGTRVVCRTREFLNGEYVTIDDWFRDYPSLQDCIEDHFAFLTQNSRYRDAGVFDAKGDESYFEALQRAGYATDPHYAMSLMAVEDTITDYFLPYLSTSLVPDAPTISQRLLMINCRPGHDVEQVQAALKAQGFYTGTPDGAFGPATYAAVLAFQRSKTIAVDGVVGPQTWKSMGL